jgi:nitrogen regulatory protein PII
MPNSLTQLVVVVRPFLAEAVLKVCLEAGATAGTVREAKGYGRQKGYLSRYRAASTASPICRRSRSWCGCRWPK